MDIRREIKRAAEYALVSSGVASVARRRMRERTLVLAYHNVVPDGASSGGDLPNHLPLSSFRAQLAALRGTHDVVPLADVLTAPAGSTKPRAAITFDDAYLGAVTHGVDELVAHGLPATIFVAPAFVGGRSFWWDALAVPGGGLDPHDRAYALHELRGEDTAIREWARERGMRSVSVPEIACVATEEQIVRAASLPGITVGSHSWSHPNLTRVTPSTLESELTRSLDWLRERARDALPWIAYPYGFFNKDVTRAVRAAGYEGALGISGGWIRPAPVDPFMLPRLNIPPGLSQRGFILRGSGL